MKKPKTSLRRMVWGEYKISLRFRSINIALFLLTSVIMAVVLINVLQNITKQVSVDYARYFAANAAGTFGAHLSKEIALVSKAVSSHQIIEWFLDENNPEKKIMAYDEMMGTINQLASNNLYIAIQKTLNEFTLEKQSKIDDIKAVGRLDPDYYDDAWYFECIASNLEYVLNVDIDKVLHRKLVWLNYKVVYNGAPIGVFCAGLNFADVAEELFSHYNGSKIRSLIIDATGIIQMDSALLNTDFLKYNNEIRVDEEFKDPKLIEAVNTWINSIDGYFEIGSEPTIVELSGGLGRSNRYRYATIAPIGSTNWSVVTLFDSSSLFSLSKLIPLFIFMAVLFIAFAFVTSIMSYRYLYKPAVEMAHSKDDFLARMSHEIRTPMNAITGMAELALREDVSDAAQEHILTIKQAGANLLSIINDILDFSKIESGKLEIIPVKYMLSSLLNDTVNIIRMRFKEKRLRFYTNIDGNIPNNLNGDEPRLRQVILNLLTNSVKYSEKGHIGLSITIVKRNEKKIWLKISVTDTGKGIKPEDLKKLFGEFVQVNTRENKGIEGTGLGLAITKRLCLAMGGDINVESEYGKGSVFTVIVPQNIESQEPFAAVEEPEKKNVLVYEGRSIYANAICWSLENMRVPYTMVTNKDDFAEALYREEWSYIFSGYGLYENIKPLMEKSDSAFCGGKKPPMALMVEWGTEAYIPGVRFMSIPVQSLAIANILNGREDIKGYNKNASAVRFTFPGARILVVDDIATNLKVAEGLLAPYRAIVDTSLTGSLSIDMVKRNKYDIIFMDHMMPGMDGVETTAAIRAWEKNNASSAADKNSASFTEGETRSNNRNSRQRIPIIALTANAVVGMREMFLENGFDDFLSKPIDISKLDEMLDRWIPKEKREKNSIQPQSVQPMQAQGQKGEAQESQEESQNASVESAEMNAFYIPGVDTAKGIAMIGGTLETYKQLLYMFCKDIDERLQFFEKEINTDTLNDFVTHIHSLKSATASIGAAEISSLAAGLEAIGKAGDAAFIRESLPDFTKKLGELKKNIISALARISLV